MPWRKNRPITSGEMEFHLTGLRRMHGERVPERHDDAWLERRFQKLEEHHRAR